MLSTFMSLTATEKEEITLFSIDVGGPLAWLAFSHNGQHLVTGGDRVRVWEVEGGKQIAQTNETLPILNCGALSRDGAYVAAGTRLGDAYVWDVETYYQLQLFAPIWEGDIITAVDFSPDSARLVIASDDTATIWDLATRQQLDHQVFSPPLCHEGPIRAAKYSPKGDRIATATERSIRVYDSNNGHLLVNIPAQVSSCYNSGLLWSNNHLFVVSGHKIKQFVADSGGSLVSEWLVHEASDHACIALPTHSGFIVYSASSTLTFWDTSTKEMLGIIRDSNDTLIRSIALSPDDRFLAVGREDGKITIHSLFRINDSIPLSCLHPTLQEPVIQIHEAALDAWKYGRLTDAEALLTEAIRTSRKASHHTLASLALVRGRLRNWDAAINDAKQSIKIQPTIIGYLALSVTLVGKGDKVKGYRACDIAFGRFHSTHVSFLLLIKAVIVSLAGEHKDAISRIDDLVATVPPNSVCSEIQAYMYTLLGNSLAERMDYEGAVKSFQRARIQKQHCKSRPFLLVSLISGWKFDDLDITIHRHLCDTFSAAGRAKEAREAVLEMVKIFQKEVYLDSALIEWVSDFTQICLSTPEVNNGAALKASRRGMAPKCHEISNSQTSKLLLQEWAKATLVIMPWKGALAAAGNFKCPRFVVYQAICESLKMEGRVIDGADCLHQMENEMAGDVAIDMKWVSDFKWRCLESLVCSGEAAVVAGRHDDAIRHYTDALSLQPASLDILIKRSEVYAAKRSWDCALEDSNQAIKLDPLSPFGYRAKHAALCGAENYFDAIEAFEIMLFKMSQSSDPEIRERSHRYVKREEMKAAIYKVVRDTVHDLPQILIHTKSGRLVDKSQQSSTFESSPKFQELICSMTTQIDHTRIELEVKQYYCYAMFSHKWEDDNEPLFNQLIHTIVYDLEESPTHDKLQMFCKIARHAGFNWAWSDTCCINKSDPSVLREAFVAMFRWYEGSSLTIIHLRGVRSPSKRGDLVKSVWNTRAWTLQEYHASKVVQFYTEDWVLYLNLHIHNHKESPEIISEMEEATRIPAQALRALQPGLGHVREKLSLASLRETSRVEDTAYSLLGIFSVSLPVVYGGRDEALGRLLAQVLTSSANTSILAWTGKSGRFNSCLPAYIRVFSSLQTTHIPPAIRGAELDATIAKFRASSLTSTLVIRLYERIRGLPFPSFVGQRMKLPCIIFELGRLFPHRRQSNSYVFHAQTTALGTVGIAAQEDLTRLEPLYLIHPWIDFLLDRPPIGSVTEAAPGDHTDVDYSSTGESPSSPDHSDTASLAPGIRSTPLSIRLERSLSGRSSTFPESHRDGTTLQPPSSVSRSYKRMQAFQLLARLSQPFGALLFTRTRKNAEEYRRVATECQITVQVVEVTPKVVKELIDHVRRLDVL